MDVIYSNVHDTILHFYLIFRRSPTTSSHLLEINSLTSYERPNVQLHSASVCSGRDQMQCKRVGTSLQTSRSWHEDTADATDPFKKPNTMEHVAMYEGWHKRGGKGHGRQRACAHLQEPAPPPPSLRGRQVRLARSLLFARPQSVVSVRCRKKGRGSCEKIKSDQGNLLDIISSDSLQKQGVLRVYLFNSAPFYAISSCIFAKVRKSKADATYETSRRFSDTC